MPRTWHPHPRPPPRNPQRPPRYRRSAGANVKVHFTVGGNMALKPKSKSFRENRKSKVENRKSSASRSTRETNITASLNLDGAGAYNVATGIGFLDHMLELLARHGAFDLTLHAAGDLHVDQHHTV